MTTARQDKQFAAFLDELHHSRGFDFRDYKQGTLKRRVEKRLQQLGAKDVKAYRTYLADHPEEFVQLFNTILINVTSFFRDPAAWDYLAQQVLPGLLTSKAQNTPIRVWSTGCASGEEAYTLAIVLAEILGKNMFRQRVKIYATDMDEEALAQARQATYSAEALQPVAPKLLEQYFEPLDGRYIFRPELRRAIIFGHHDLLTDAPISRLDLIVCRNTLMYFTAEAQERVLARFHFALQDHGLLFMGRAEMLLTHANLFAPVELKQRIFSKVPQENMRDRLLLLAQAEQPDLGALGRQLRLRDMGFDSAPVAQVVLDLSGTLALANRQARTSFGLAVKDIGRPFQDLELSYRPVELRASIEEAHSQRRSVRRTNIERTLPDGTGQRLEVEVVPLQENGGGMLGMSILFHDVSLSSQLEIELLQSKQEAETVSEELQSTNEELETTNEELQSTVEELETTNEELQSTNEEMETMNEELQSTNAELQTVNEELHKRTDELNTSNGFLQSILAGLGVGVAVIDRNSQILIWNARAQDLWGLQSDEVHQQSFFELDIGLPVKKLQTQVRRCQSGKRHYDAVELAATNRRGRAIHCRVTCSALRGLGIAPQGVIIMMEEMAS